MQIPNYAEYSLLELIQALNTVREDSYPEVFETLEAELYTRGDEARHELEQAYFALDRDKRPKHAEWIRARACERVDHTEPDPLDPMFRYKTYWARVWANSIDGIVVSLAAIPAYAVIAASAVKIESIDAAALASIQVQIVIVQEILIYVTLAYTVLMHAFFGQTLGKMATGVKVIDVSEDHGIGLKQALVRDSVLLVVYVIGTVFKMLHYVMGYPLSDGMITLWSVAALSGFVWMTAEVITMLFNKKRRAVHDLLARTVVVRVRQPKTSLF